MSSPILPALFADDEPESAVRKPPAEIIEEALRANGYRQHRSKNLNGDETHSWDCPVCPPEKSKGQLSLIIKDDGGVIPYCFRKCHTTDIVSALGLKNSDLFAFTSLEDILDDNMFQFMLGRTADVTQRQRDAYDKAVAEEVWKLHIREQGKRDYQEFYGMGDTYPGSMETDDLESLPDAEWLIKGVLEKGVVAFLVGFTGTCKSFLALDWSMCVSTGREWMKRRADYGPDEAEGRRPVLYIPGEGGAGYKKRARAWMSKRHTRDLSFMKWKSGAVQLMSDAHLQGLITDVRKFGIRLVVIDTLSTCFVGYDQIDQTATGQLFQRLKKVRDAIEPNGTTVLVVHHTGWADKGRSRGSSDFKSSADAEYVLEAASEDDIFQGVRLTVTKMKDEEAGLRFSLMPEKVDIGKNAEGEDMTSLVLAEAQGELTMGQKVNDPRRLDQQWRQEHLRTYTYENRPYTLSEIMSVMNSCRASNDQMKSAETLRRDLAALDWEQTTGARGVKLYQRKNA